MSELSSSLALRLDADKLAQRLRNGRSVLFEPAHPPVGVPLGMVLMVDPVTRPLCAGDVVLLVEPTLQAVRVYRVRAHLMWVHGYEEPLPIEHALGLARTPPLSFLQRLRAWWAR